MITRLSKVLAGIALLLLTQASVADSPLRIAVQNPEKAINYIVGDRFRRSVELDVPSPYKLQPGSLPVKGTSMQGIELDDVRLTEKQFFKNTHYRLQLDYQIFRSSDHAIKIELPPQKLKVAHAGLSYNIVVPAWQFRVSPIAAQGVVDVEADMSPYRGPLLVNPGYLPYVLGGFLLMTLIAAAGLIYINADKTWFPGMGGPFAASYREIERLGYEPQHLKIAVTSIHRAFNRTYGENLFAHDLPHFIQMHARFAAVSNEIAQFFSLSDSILFGSGADLPPATALAALADFCAQCRHCERGVA